MSDYEIANVTAGSTRIIATIGSPLNDLPLGENENLDVTILINNRFDGEGFEYFAPELDLQLVVSTNEASLYVAEIGSDTLDAYFGHTDEILSAKMQTYLQGAAEWIDKFNSVTEII